MQDPERGCTRSHSVENSLRKGLCTYRKTDYRMNATIHGLQTLDRETYFRATVGLFHGLFQDDFSNWSYVALNGWMINEEWSRIHILVLKQTCTTVLCHVLVDNSTIFLEIFHSSSAVILICLAVLIAALYTITKDGRNELFTLTSGLYWFSWSVPYKLSFTQCYNPTWKSQKAEITDALTSCRS